MIESYFNRLSNHTLIDSIEWELYFLALLWHFSSTFRAIGIWKDGSDAPSDLSIWANWRSPQLRSFMEVCKKPTPTARNFAPIRGENSQRWSSLSVLLVLSVLSVLSVATLLEFIFVSYHRYCHWCQQNQHIRELFTELGCDLEFYVDVMMIKSGVWIRLSVLGVDRVCLEVGSYNRGHGVGVREIKMAVRYPSSPLPPSYLALWDKGLFLLSLLNASQWPLNTQYPLSAVCSKIASENSICCLY